MKYDRPTTYDPNTGYPWAADRQLAGWIPDGTKVLEIGAATGYFGRHLRENKKCQITGLDMTAPDGAIVGRIYDSYIVGDLDRPETLDQIKDSFDVVLCAAVLEHLKNPATVLSQLKRLLKSEGRLIVSLPNIAHWSIRLKLLLGKFQYEKYGLLDDTHLRFFTYHSAHNFFTDAGYTIKKVSIDPDSGIPLLNGLMLRLPGGGRLIRKLYGFLPNLFAYQLLFQLSVE